MKIESESTHSCPRLSELGVMALDHNWKAGLSSALRVLLSIVAVLYTPWAVTSQDLAS